MNEEDLWRAVRDYPAYEVNREGVIRAIGTDKPLAQVADSAGRRQVNLIEGLPKPKKLMISRLMYATWHDMDLSDYVVKHRDGKKSNGHIDNLYLCWKNGRPVDLADKRYHVDTFMNGYQRGGL